MEIELKDIAEQIAGEAAAVVLAGRETLLSGEFVQVDTKTSQTDPVTTVDLRSEQFIRRRLAELRPEDQILGEEYGGDPGDGVTWLVDPIDGTVNFLYGFPWFSVSIAAQIGGVSVAGAVVEPFSGRRWTAARGHGAWLDGRPLRCSAPEKLELALIGTGFSYSRERRVHQARFVGGLLQQVRDIRRTGAASLDLCAVAAGWLDGYVEQGLGPWDWAAGALVASEAGAQIILPGEDAELGTDTTFAAAPSIAKSFRSTIINCGIGSV